MPPTLLLHPNTLVFFVDETGHETFADPKFPVFGLAGITIYAGLIDELVREPWRQLKDDHFGGRNNRLHASALRDVSSSQATAVGNFFKEGRFGRFGVAMTSKTILPDGIAPYTFLPGLLRNRWKELVGWVNPTPERFAIIHESSDRGDALVERFFGPTHVTIDGKDLPVEHALIPKNAGDEAMEVADFAAHALGREAYRQEFSANIAPRRDFGAVFTAASDRSSVFVARSVNTNKD